MNHRLEYYKGPVRLFGLFVRFHQAGIAFRLAVAGENFRNQPAEFEVAHTRLAAQIVHWGYVDSRRAYADLLRQADLVVSTADHEFFGLSILEAICAGAFPLLPARLSYPELIPPALHPACLYVDDDDLFDKAAQRLTAAHADRQTLPSLQRHIATAYAWPVAAAQLDAWLTTTATHTVAEDGLTPPAN